MRHFDLTHLKNRILPIGMLLFFSITLCFIVTYKSHTQDVSATVAVYNEDPSIVSIQVNNGPIPIGFIHPDPSTPQNDLYYNYPNTYSTPNAAAISLSPGADRTIHVTGIIMDVNGVGTSLSTGDLAVVAARLYKSTINPDDCLPSPTPVAGKNSCYFVASMQSTNDCTLTPESDTQISFDCPIPIKSWAEPTTDFATIGQPFWNVQVITADDAGAGSNHFIFSTEIKVGIDSLLAVNTPTSISFGTVNPGHALDTSITSTMTQYGNVDAGLRVSGGDLTCTIGSTTIGTIPVANQHWSLSSSTAWADATPLGTDISAEAANTLIDIGLRTSDTVPVTVPIYWNIFMPTSGVGGTCTGTTVINAFAK